MGAAGSAQRGAHCSAMGVGLSVWFCRNSSAVSVAGDSFRHQENVHPTGMWWLTCSGLPTSRGDLEGRAPHGTGELPPWSLSALGTLQPPQIIYRQCCASEADQRRVWDQFWSR